MPKITVDDGQWVRLREHNLKFKSGERRALYEKVDSLQEMGQVAGSYRLMQHIAAFIIEDWSLDVPRPQAVMAAGYGSVTFEHMESFDELDTDLEDEIFVEAGWWMGKLAINFGPTNDAASPTKPSGG
uniref:hypothetical protein n=1 Tax=Pseudonocardia sp. CA-138482 TaxID=3240023 RepID=UPI003F4999B9